MTGSVSGLARGASKLVFHYLRVGLSVRKHRAPEPMEWEGFEPPRRIANPGYSRVPAPILESTPCMFVAKRRTGSVSLGRDFKNVQMPLALVSSCAFQMPLKRKKAGFLAGPALNLSLVRSRSYGPSPLVPYPAPLAGLSRIPHADKRGTTLCRSVPLPPVAISFCMRVFI